MEIIFALTEIFGLLSLFMIVLCWAIIFAEIHVKNKKTNNKVNTGDSRLNKKGRYYEKRKKD